jgi:predicted N-acetyltransferase YhbS
MTGRSSGRARTVEHGAYTIRPYDSGDVGGVSALFETVWGSDRSAEWLAYRYETNPYLDGPPMIVAARDGEVVGARPFVAFPVRAGNEDATAVYLGNVTVHPEHRRQGLFTQMTQMATEEYADSDGAFFFNFANEQSAPGYRDLDFVPVGVGPEKRLRIQRPGQLARDRTRLPVGRSLAGLADDAMAAVLSRRRRERSPSRWHVEREAGVAAALLTRLYDDADQPIALHTRREETLYRWLGNGPYWQYETYVASTAGAPAAAVLVRRRSGRRDRDVWVVDAVPPRSRDHLDAYRALLEAVVADHRDARVVAATGPVVQERLLPDAALREFGFLSSTRPVLAQTVDRADTVFVHALGERVPTLSVGGLDLRDPENWALAVRRADGS